MKLNQIALAVAALAAAPAFAAAPAITDTPDYTIFLSGASAPDGFLATLATGYFGAGNFITAKDDNNTPADLTDDGKLFNGYYGTLAAAVGTMPAGAKVKLIKRSQGGSVWGVNPVIRGQHIQTLNFTSAACTGGPSAYVCPIVGTEPTATQDFPASGAMQPDFGVSDVAPGMFKAPYNVEFGQSELSTAELTAANPTITAANTLMMGIAVTKTVPTTTHISAADYSAILGGAIYDWNTSFALGLPAAKAHTVVCRRVPGSGTQSSYNWYFNNFPCTTSNITGTDGNTVPLRMTDSASYDTAHAGTTADPYLLDVTAGVTIVENSGSGDVFSCLDKANDGGVHLFKNEEGKYVSVNFGTGGYGAIGVLSIDSQSKMNTAATAASTGFTFRTLNGAGVYDTVAGTCTGTGVCPSKANLIEGDYEFASELTFQHRGDLATVRGQAVQDFVTDFIARAGDPTFNTARQVAALPVNYAYPTANVAKATRFGNMCAPLQKLY